MLTTKEFIKKVEELDEYTARIENQDDGRMVSVYDSHNVMARIYADRLHKMSIYEHISPELFSLICEYAQTPIDKREKKGRLWIKNVGQNGESINTISHVLVCEEHENIVFFATGNTANNLNLQTEYTESEKEEIEKKTGVPLEFIEE